MLDPVALLDTQVVRGSAPLRPTPVTPRFRLGATALTARSDSHLGWCEPADGAADTGNPLSEHPLRCLAGAPSSTGCSRGGLAQAWVEATEELRGDELPLPERSAPREVDLG